MADIVTNRRSDIWLLDIREEAEIIAPVPEQEETLVAEAESEEAPVAETVTEAEPAVAPEAEAESDPLARNPRVKRAMALEKKRLTRSRKRSG